MSTLLQQTNKLSASGIPFIRVPTGTMANNGAYTSGTALPTTYQNAYCYFAANQIFSGSAAGWYFTQFTSSTVGTVYNNTYSGGQPGIPQTLVPFASTGPGSITGDTTLQNGPQITVDPGTLGPNGFIRVTHLWAMNNSANNKTLQVLFNGTPVYNQSLTTNASNSGITPIFVRGNSSQVTTPSGSDGAQSGSGALNYPTVSIGTTPPPSVQVALQLATATDFLVLEGFAMEFMYGA